MCIARLPAAGLQFYRDLPTSRSIGRVSSILSSGLRECLALRTMTEPSAPSLTDKRLWAGAEKQGWTIVNRGNVEGTGKYWYVSPTGHRCESKAAAQQAQLDWELQHLSAELQRSGG